MTAPKKAKHSSHADSVTTYYFASGASRFAAWIIDGLIVGFAVAILTAILIFSVPNHLGVDTSFIRGSFSPEELNMLILSSTLVVSIVWLLISTTYHAAMLVAYGQSLGKMVTGIKVLTVEGDRLTWGTAILRSATALVLSRQILYLGYIWAFFQPQHQAWHDMIARTFVVKA